MGLSSKSRITGTIISFFAMALFLVYLTFSLLGFNSEVQILTIAAGILLVSSFIWIFIYRYFKKNNQFAEIDYLNIGFQRNLLGIFMVFYGVPKLFGTFFDYQLFALDSKLGEVSEFQLAWYYFGKNKWQELFTGIMEFFPGLLLLSRRTYYWAAIILLPVTAQVFILNFFFKIGGVTFPAACVLLACNAYILYSQKEKIIQFYKSLNFNPVIHLGNKTQLIIKACKWSGIALLALIIFINLKRSFFSSEDSVNYQKLVGVYTLDEITADDSLYTPMNDSIYYKDLYIEKQSRWNILRRFNNKTDAFILKLNSKNDSLQLYINKGGIGDNPDIIDSASVLKGAFKLSDSSLNISGIQYGKKLQLSYKKQNIRPKDWFW